MSSIDDQNPNKPTAGTSRPSTAPPSSDAESHPLSSHDVEAAKRSILGLDSDTPDAARGSEDPIDASHKAAPRPVGYKNPPRHTRFKKGQSGNPKGRPRTPKPGRAQPGAVRATQPPSLTPSEQMFAREGKRRVLIKENGKPTWVTMNDAVTRSAYTQGAKGRPQAQKLVFERREALETKEQEMRTYLIEVWRTIKENNQQILDRIAAGEELPEPLPHPDDILITPDQEPKILGPWDEASLAKLNMKLDMRDHFLLEHLYEQAYGPVLPDEVARFNAHRAASDPYHAYRMLAAEIGDPNEHDVSITGGELYIHYIDKELPPRLRWEATDWLAAETDLKRRFPSRRALEKALTRSRKRQGFPIPRGTPFLTAACVIDLFKFLGDALAVQKQIDRETSKDARSDGLDPETVSSPPIDPHTLFELLNRHSLKRGRLTTTRNEAGRTA